MKLVLATPLFPPDAGGPSTYAKLLADTLPGRNCSVALVKFGDFRNKPKLVRHLEYFFAVRRAANDADAVLALDPVSTGLPAALAAKMAKKPFYLKVVGDYAWEQGVQRFGVTATLDEFLLMQDVPFAVDVLRDIERFVARQAKKVIVPSEYLKRVVLSWGIAEENIEVIYNAVPMDESGTVPKAVAALPRPLIASVGRLVPWKGIDGCIEAVRLARTTQPLSLAVVGDGPSHDALTAHARTSLESGYAFTGELSHADTLAVMRSADAFVLNTSYEGLSHLLIEAVTLGLPIITTPVGGNPEVIEHEKTGLFVPVGDTAALAAALTRVFEDANLREMLSRNAKAASTKFSIDALSARTAAVLSA